MSQSNTLRSATPESPGVSHGESIGATDRLAGEDLQTEPPFTPSTPLHSAELRYLNENYSFPLRPAKGKQGRLRSISQRFARPLRRWLFGEYLDQQVEYQENLVRYLNDLGRTVDRAYFELLVRIEQNFTALSTRIDRATDNSAGAVIAAQREIQRGVKEQVDHLNSYIGDLRAQVAGHTGKIDILDSVCRGLEQIVSLLGKPPTSSSSSKDKPNSAPSSPATSQADFDYLLFENRFRGSEETIRKRLEIYPPHFRAAKKPVLEIGCGRGELLSLLKENQIQSYGIELDSGMAAAARSRGFEIIEESALTHLAKLPAGSLGGVIAVQVIEHLTPEQLLQLVKLCAEKIEDDGLVIFETINSASMVALTQHYFRDPTHKLPLHPETMRFMLQSVGLKVEAVTPLSPFPEEAQFRLLQPESYMTPRWLSTVEQINSNFNRLNQLLFGHQDYCIIGRVSLSTVSRNPTDG